MPITKTDPMQYLPDMEALNSDIMINVLDLKNTYEPEKYTSEDVLKALNKNTRNLSDFAALLSPAAFPFLEDMATCSQRETKKHFGNSVSLFTPLYISNYCENYCSYCGFSCHSQIKRAKLTLAEIENELITIAKSGLEDILLLTGESRSRSGLEYIGEAIRLASRYFKLVGIEIYPLNTDEYSYLHECGADYVCVYQETYDTARYEQVHLSGHKRVYPYRFDSQERALLGGMRSVSFGALLGLADFRKDAFATGAHAFLLQKKYPKAEISFSLPRLRPLINNAGENPNEVHEPQLLQVMLAYRLLMPFAGITISTRERAGFRDNVVGICATKISAGVKVSVGGHEEEAKGDEQFMIADYRSVEDIHKMLLSKDLQPVYSDYIRT